jgi:hypothetical protein
LTTSNNTSWELTRDEIITSAYAKIGIPGEDNAVSAVQITRGAQELNAIIAWMVTMGMPLWKRTSQNFTPSVTSQIYVPTAAVKVVQVVLLDNNNGSQYDLIEKSLYDFNRLPSASIGTPVHYTFQPTLGSGTVSIWPYTSDTTTVSAKTIQVVYQKKFDGFFNSTETPDFPSYWIQPLTYKLALTLAPEYGLPLNDRQQLKAEFKDMVDGANGYGDEDGSLYIQPDRMGKW